MGDFVDSIKKKLDAARGDHSAISGGLTMTGEQPNEILIEPEARMNGDPRKLKESVDPSLHEKHHVIFWGRANPPHIGHEEAYKKVKDVARRLGATASMVLTRTHDKKKNPLTPEQKEKHAKAAFPDVNTHVTDEEHPTLLHHLSKLHENGITDIHLVAGSDRIPSYQKLINDYNGKHGPHGYYNFKTVNLHSAGERDPDAEGVAGMSASVMRNHAATGRQKEFEAGAPSSMSPAQRTEMYNDVRSGMAPKKEVKEAFTGNPTNIRHFNPTAPLLTGRVGNRPGFQSHGAVSTISQAVSQQKKSISASSQASKLAAQAAVKRAKTSTAHDAQQKHSLDQHATSQSYANASRTNPAKPQNEAAETKKKYKKTTAVAVFTDKGSDGQLSDNAYEATRYNIPFERTPAQNVDLGYDKSVADADAKRQLRRRQAMKLFRYRIDEEPGEGGFGGAGLGMGEKSVGDLTPDTPPAKTKLRKPIKTFRGKL
jgi:DNA-binding transcriptional ArsR family regulator